MMKYYIQGVYPMYDTIVQVATYVYMYIYIYIESQVVGVFDK